MLHPSLAAEATPSSQPQVATAPVVSTHEQFAPDMHDLSALGVSGAEFGVAKLKLRQIASQTGPQTVLQFDGLDFRTLFPGTRAPETAELSVSVAPASVAARTASSAVMPASAAEQSIGPEPLALGALLPLFARRKEERRSGHESKREDAPKESPQGAAPEPEHAGGPVRQFISRCADSIPGRIAIGSWKLWRASCNLLPEPMNKVATYAGPVLAAATLATFYNSIATTAVLGLQLFGETIKPIALTGAALAATLLVDPAYRLLARIKDFAAGDWRQHLITKPLQAAMVVGTLVYVQSVELSVISYAAWTGAALAAGYLASKIIPSRSRGIWAATAAAALMPLGDQATIRNYDVTVKNAGPDPEVGAWNVGTDLSVADHWRGQFFLKQKPPSGGDGMVLLNRDVSLLFPPHREGNSFNSKFQELVGKKVRVTTINAWLKLFSPNMQPTIIGFKVLDEQPTQKPAATNVAPAAAESTNLLTNANGPSK